MVSAVPREAESSSCSAFKVTHSEAKKLSAVQIYSQPPAVSIPLVGKPIVTKLIPLALTGRMLGKGHQQQTTPDEEEVPPVICFLVITVVGFRQGSDLAAVSSKKVPYRKILSAWMPAPSMDPARILTIMGKQNPNLQMDN